MGKPFVANAEEPQVSGDEALITALAYGATVEAAAAKAGISRATAYRRLRTPEVRQRVKELKGEMVARTAAMLSAAGSEAVRTLLLLLGGGYSSSSRLGAARAILEMGCRVREMAEWEERLATLEQRFLDGDHVLT